MLPGIFDTTRIVSINIYISLISANSGLAINISVFLINTKNDSNNYRKSQEDCTLAMRCQKTIKKKRKPIFD